jgi:hypothetical protein
VQGMQEKKKNQIGGVPAVEEWVRETRDDHD